MIADVRRTLLNRIKDIDLEFLDRFDSVQTNRFVWDDFWSNEDYNSKIEMQLLIILYPQKHFKTPFFDS